MLEQNLSARYDRQRDAYPPDKLKMMTAVVIGCGAIGHPLILGLAKMGVGKIIMVDPDTVEIVNLAVQGYREKDLGLPKVAVCTSQVEELNSSVEVTYIQSRYNPDKSLFYQILESVDIDNELIVFSAVDNMPTRVLLYEHFVVDNYCTLFIDGRIAGQVIQTLACVPGHKTEKYYKTQLHDESESVELPCSIRTQLFPSEMCASMLIAQLGNWIRSGVDGIAHNCLIDTALLQDLSSVVDPLPVSN